MVETCAGFSWLTQFVLVSGQDEELNFSALPLRSGPQIKSLQFMTDIHSIIILAFYYCS